MGLAWERFHRERIMKMVQSEPEFDGPHNETQAIVDHMERPYGDEQFNDDDDFDPEMHDSV